MYPFKYFLGSEGLEVRLGGFVVRQVKYADIQEVRRGYAAWNEHWNNLYPISFVTIRRKTGLFKNFVINPWDRDTFVAQLKQRLHRQSPKSSKL